MILADDSGRYYGATMHEIQPTVGQWYLRPTTGQKFEVIDIDDGDGMIEIQDEEGTLDQVDSDIWFTEAVEVIDQPQHFTGALDSVSTPDEADGGDPVEPDVPDTEPLRVAQDEMLYSTDEDDDEDEDEEHDGRHLK
jgi:hypothetical protein